ncbi:hypothetical protein [Candidatus Spongiihabitans sp.]|uniref:hypothetical protein n=1 Tax=Candidatus Spongiihabitans sp. TaxID=3101308 RepID=UPI003C6EE324
MRSELETTSQTRGNFGVISLVFLACIAMVMLMSSPTAADAKDSVAIDGLGFNAITDHGLFSSGFKFQGKGNISDRNSHSVRMAVQMETTVEAESSDWSENSLHIAPLHALTDSSVGSIGFMTPSSQSQGFKVNRISASWETEAGTLTVGNDWTSLQDFLSVNKGFESANVSAQNRTVVSQIKWLSPNGFSISLENSPRTSLYSTDSGLSNSIENNTSPNLILSWQGGPGGTVGVYRVTAMGTKFETPASGQNLDRGDITGWGLNLEGGWQMGDLFAALSVTFGKGIDSYILQRSGNDLVVAPNYLDELGNSLSIQPSLYYRLNNNSNFHVSLGHYASEGAFNDSGIDTLDTINMGYSWSLWPSTKFGFELVDQDTDSRNGLVE